MRTDLIRRHRQPEIMDAPDLPPARFVETLKGLGRVNSVTRSSRLMWPDLKATARRHSDRAIRVLDVACGGGDVLIALWRAAQRAGLRVELAGCDLSATAVSYAEEAAVKAGAPITFFQHRVTKDALPEGYDLIMSTLFLHHLDEDEAISFLREAAAKTRDRAIASELQRKGGAGKTAAHSDVGSLAHDEVEPLKRRRSRDLSATKAWRGTKQRAARQ